jgi:CRISPR-associated exonuclease Cas4
VEERGEISALSDEFQVSENEFENIDISDLKIQGIKVNYALICERKLWFFSKGIAMESDSERVLLGKFLHAIAYSDEGGTREALIDNTIKIDIVGEIIREVKLSDKMAHADEIQLKYYIYYLIKKFGVRKKGILNYPKMKKLFEIELRDEDMREVEKVLKDVVRVEKLEKPPPPLKKPYCKSCAYYNFCWV